MKNVNSNTDLVLKIKFHLFINCIIKNLLKSNKQNDHYRDDKNEIRTFKIK